MPWQQVSPGFYERSFDSIEEFYRTIAAAGAPLQKQHYLISGRIRFRSAISVTALQDAWKAIRHQYPQMAAVADETRSKLTYTVPSSLALKSWMRETFIVVEDESSSADSLYSTLAPSHVFKLYYLPHTREVLFRTPHWRVDGMGMVQFQHAFLSILANGPPAALSFDGSEAARLALPLDEAASVPQDITAAMSEAADAELSPIFDRTLPSISVPTLPNALPTQTKRVGINLPAHLSQAILTACKKRGITVTTAVHAAMLVATKPYAQVNFDPATRGIQRPGRYVAFNAIDVRKYLPAPWNGPDAAVSVYHTGLPFIVALDANSDFDSLTDKIAPIYRRDLSKNAPRNMFDFLSLYVHKTLGVLGALPEDPLKAPAHPEVSSLGLVDKYVQSRYEGKAARFELEDWWMAVEVINRVLVTYVWTWNGRLHLGFNYNDAFYDESFVETYLHDWKRALVRELGVQDDVLDSTS